MFRGSCLRRFFVLLLVLFLPLALPAACPAGTAVKPFEADEWTIPPNEIDVIVSALLKKEGRQWASPCSDEVFIRRVYLDVIGTLPDAGDVAAFLSDTRPDKRAVLIDSLLTKDEFADYWSLKWCDLLRVKAEFPINLWPNAVQAYHGWIHQALHSNQPYDQFVREILVSSGSNFRQPEVNFYRAVQARTSQGIAATVALTFMGTRYEKWPEARREGMAAFFSRVAYKKTAEWKEEIVYLNPAPFAGTDAVFPDGRKVHLSPDGDPRAVFAEWLTTPTNPWFSRNIANRVWSWLMGHGLIYEVDDIRPDNPPSSPELLACLEKKLTGSGFDLKQLYRLILNSRAYQQSSIVKASKPGTGAYFDHYQVRRLEAEVLLDAICAVTDTGEGYSSPIPEPFTNIPSEQRSILLADGSITSPFLETFGRSPRDTGLESERVNQPSSAQQMYLMNATHIQNKIKYSSRLAQMLRNVKWQKAPAVQQLYLMLLSRYPTPEEMEKADKYLKTEGLNTKDGLDDLTWTLINSKEFLYRH